MQRSFLFLGFLVVTAIWLGPLPELASRAFFAHMMMHMGIVAIASPLLALGISGLQFDPVRKAPRFFSPILASVFEFIVVWAWHTPMLHHAARHSAAGMIIEQSLFLGSGLLLWLSSFGIDVSNNYNRPAAGVIALLLTSMHMTLLGALLALAPRLLYDHTNVPFALTPLEDQQLGGAIMLVIGGIAYLIGGLWLMARLLKSKFTEAKENA